MSLDKERVLDHGIDLRISAWTEDVIIKYHDSEEEIGCVKQLQINLEAGEFPKAQMVYYTGKTINFDAELGYITDVSIKDIAMVK